MCIGMCIGMCTDTHMSRHYAVDTDWDDLNVHVYWHVYTHVYGHRMDVCRVLDRHVHALSQNQNSNIAKMSIHISRHMRVCITMRTP